MRGQSGRFVIGIDEAGRGSIVGEMFVAGFAAPPALEEALVDMGVRDSKQLTPHRRAELYRELVRMGHIHVVAVPPSEIDSRNLNLLTEEAAIKIVDALARRLGGYDRLSVIIIDKFGAPRRLPAALRARGFRGLLIVEEGADVKYPHVSAASIVAKHLRDLRIRVLSSLYGVKGSGYPSDPRTMEWVREVLSRGERPPIIRYSWSSLREYGFGHKRRGRRTLDEWLGRR